MNNQDLSDAEMRRVYVILEAISKEYPADSEEAHALREAALAYTIVQKHETLKKKYRSLRLALGGELTEEMKVALQHCGIEPDDLEEESLQGGVS